MTYEIIESSPKALAKVEATEDAYGVENELTHQRAKFPWQLLKIGQSFAVPVSEGNEASLRNSASQFSKKTGKKFAVLRHSDLQLLECARLR